MTRLPHLTSSKDLLVDDAYQRMWQPVAMKTNAYVGGVEKVSGHDAWALFKACAAGDMPLKHGATG